MRSVAAAGVIAGAIVASYAAGLAPVTAQGPAAPAWRQWGGPERTFTVPDAPRLADSWPESGPPTLWSRPLGTGHSTILVDEGRLYTMYRVGNGRNDRGPYDAEEIVVAMDAATGKTMWEYKYASAHADFSRGAGPHTTPIIVGDRLFAFGTNKQLHAFEKRSGKLLWSHDLVKEFGAPPLDIRPVIKSGFSCSPIAYRDTIICMVGGPGQAVMAFRQSDGSVAWKSGHFLPSGSSPILVSVDGQEQLVVFAGATVNGLDPANGAVLWSHPHDAGNDFNYSTPVWGPDNILFVTSAYRAGARAITLTKSGPHTQTEDLWFTNKVRFMFLNTLRIGDYIYGTTGDFGPSFLTAVNLKTGQTAWQHRGFSRASILHADGKAILLDEDGDLAIARFSPEGVTVLSQVKLFDTISWTAPTLAGSTLYARDREKIVALDLAAR
jgi:outer membrane protein assembly factor BamB